jgi:hypothetical protein
MGLESHNFPEWPAAMDVQTALAYTGVGERVWGLGHNRQYVQFVRPNGDHILNAHPLDVLPVSERPKAYQTEGDT